MFFEKLVSLVSVDFKHCASYSLPSSTSSNLTEQNNSRDAFPQYARTGIPGCERYTQSPVMVEAVPAQITQLFFHGRVSMAFPTPTMSLRPIPDSATSTPQIQSGVVRIKNEVRHGICFALWSVPQNSS